MRNAISPYSASVERASDGMNTFMVATLTNLEELLLKLFTRETVWKGNKLREASSKGYMKEI